eukprot:304577-Prorocentrum_minimum.AAC.1
MTAGSSEPGSALRQGYVAVLLYWWELDKPLIASVNAPLYWVVKEKGGDSNVFRTGILGAM